MKNYVRIKKLSLFNYHYVFVDTEKYLADQLFIKHKVKVKFGPEFVQDANEYRFIICKIKKKDNEAFLLALSEMRSKSILRGYKEYDKYCELLDKR